MGEFSFPPVLLLKIKWAYVYGSILGLFILFHWSSCLFLCQYHTLLITIILQHVLKYGSTKSSSTSYFSPCPPLPSPSRSFWLFRLFLFHINFMICLFIKKKNPAGVVTEIALDPEINSVRFDFLIILTLSIPKCGNSFHLFGPFKNSLCNVCSIQCRRLAHLSLILFLGMWWYCKWFFLLW